MSRAVWVSASTATIWRDRSLLSMVLTRRRKLDATSGAFLSSQHRQLGRRSTAQQQLADALEKLTPLPLAFAGTAFAYWCTEKRWTLANAAAPAGSNIAAVADRVPDAGELPIGGLDIGTAKARAEASLRAARLVWTAVVIAADYKAHDAIKAVERWRFGDDVNPETSEYEKLQQDLSHAQDEQGKAGIEAEMARNPQERASARARGKVWYAAVNVAAQRLAKAEAAGLRAPMSHVHRRAAERLLGLCGTNGGVYVKLGQHLSQLDFILPNEFIEVLQSMLDQAPRTDIGDVREVIREELGDFPEKLWKSFDPEPIASASLAQVHRALSWDGVELAVKVQHRGLRETSTGDVDAVCLVVKVVDSLFPKFSYKWLADEMADNLPLELNFLHEAENSRKCAAMFEKRDDICVPPVVAEQTTERVLTMHFEPGLRATDVDGMLSQGVSLPRVARLISEAFCEQMFRHGSVHCDPHGANILVRPHPTARKGSGRPQLVLLDHGLYRDLTEQFRVDHCRLWKAMVFKDIPGIKKYCQRMNAGELYHLLAAMLSSRSWDDIQDTDSGMGGLHGKDVEAEKPMVRGYVQKYASEIALLLSKVDRQLLLLFKTNDCLRHIDRKLGAPINTFVIAARTCVSVLRQEDADEAMVRLGLGRRNFAMRGLLYAIYYIRGIPEALKVRAQLWAMGVQERLLERRVQQLR